MRFAKFMQNSFIRLGKYSNADLAPIIAEWYKTMEQWVQE